MTTSRDALLKKLERTQQKYRETLKVIRDNSELSSEGKARYAREAFEAATAEHRKLAEQLRTEVREQRERAERAVFRRHNDYSPAQQMNLRDALGRVDGVEDEERLGHLLEQANDFRDEPLARAVAYRANEAGLQSVLDKYHASRPDAKAAYEEWTMAFADERTLPIPPEPERPKELVTPGSQGSAA